MGPHPLPCPLKAARRGTGRPEPAGLPPHDRGTVHGPSLVIGVHLIGASGPFGIPEPVLDRLRCHFLLTQLPDQAVPDAMECLADMVGFYENPPPPYRLLPQGPPITGTIGETIVRPVYPVTDLE